MKRLLIAISLAAASVHGAETGPKSSIQQKGFKSFTGKVTANKVRIRAKADLESPIVRQVGKNELLLIVGEEADFWAVQPPKDTKAYIFRSYVLDDVVEANRVNVRLEPNVDAPVIGQLQAGERVHGDICQANHKWLEISPPAHAKFYVSKEFIQSIGGPEQIISFEKRRTEADSLLASACFIAEIESKKPFEEMNPAEAIEKFERILSHFNDFTSVAEAAKQGLALLKEAYLQKKITYLEARSELSPEAKKDLLAKHRSEVLEVKADPMLFARHAKGKKDLADSLRFWDTVEESLFLSWNAYHVGKHADDFYAEQIANASLLKGTIESYPHPVKNRPGDFVLKRDGAPVAYLYSTKVNLEELAGKEVSLVASPRPNNHFAFPAYFVLEASAH